jgi:flagellar biosynthetic protein FlhB
VAETAGEKTLAPSEKRLKDAAKEGDVLRSRDLAVAVATLVGASVLKMAGPWLFAQLSAAMRMGLTFDRAELDDFNPGRLLLGLGLLGMPPVLMVGAAVLVATLIAQLGITGQGRFVGSAMAPKASRLNPMNGLSRMLGPQGWIEVGKGLVKVILLGSIAWSWGHARIDGLMRLGAVSLSGQLAYGWQAITSLLVALSAGLVVIGLFDFPIQWIRRQRRLRMSLQEMKDEHKEADGSPEAKNARRQRQRQLAMSGIAASMQKAQFVVTNPTRFAVALAYDPALASAPVVLAKGRGEKAAAIRQLAAENALPCLEYPALARSLYFTTRERQMIREELYVAVAGVLSFVFALKRGEDRPAPVVEVPLPLRFDAEGRPAPDA